MKKKFNITGGCFPEKHYMVNPEKKIKQIFSLIEEGEYFTINRPRQYGKTTILSSLFLFLQEKEDFFPIQLSFEGLGEDRFQNEKKWIKGFLLQLQHHFRINQKIELAEWIQTKTALEHLDELGYLLSELVLKIQKKTILIIDEVDQSSNHRLFLDFLGLLRKKYLLRDQGQDATFHSVILAGVHDVKSLKLKIRNPGEKAKFNSPWNIAADFKVVMSFRPDEIDSMLEGYVREKKVEMKIPEIAEKLYYYTSGYPFLVSKLCKIMDEELMGESSEWNNKLLEKAVQQLLLESNTNFEHLIKTLENQENLFRRVSDLLIAGISISFNMDNPDLYEGMIHGVFRRDNGNIKIHNRIYEQRIYNYLSSKLETSSVHLEEYNYPTNFIRQNGTLDFEKVLLKFQEFMREEYSKKDKNFLERNGRLLFLSFLKPILNGKGFDFKEPETSEEKRLDVVVTFLNQKYVVELKLWYGPKKHEEGLKQLSDYLDRHSLDKGYLIIFDKRTEKKEWKTERPKVNQKEIFAIWV